MTMKAAMPTSQRVMGERSIRKVSYQEWL